MYSRARIVCVAAFFCSLIIFVIFFAPAIRFESGDSDLGGCPKIRPCSEVASLSDQTFKEGSGEKNKDSEVEHEKEIKVCIAYLIHKHKREREAPFTFYYHNQKIIYDIVHVYSKNDDYPKDDRQGYIIFPEFADYNTLLKKVWFGLSYFRDKNCDFVFKMDDDVTLDFLTFSYIIEKVKPATWIGRYEKGGRKADLNPGSKWHGIPFVKYTKRDTYTDFMYGQMYGFGRELYECIVNDIDKRVAAEAGAEHQFVGLHLEDVGMAYIVHQCKGIEGFDMRRLDGLYYGSYLSNINKINWIGPLVEHMKVPTRKGSAPLWETI